MYSRSEFIKIRLIFFILLFLPGLGWATAAPRMEEVSSGPLSLYASNETYDYPDYYEISPANDSADTDLMNWRHHFEKFPVPSTSYNRQLHFGSWIDDRVEGTCLNTRGKVLARDSRTTVTFSPSGCRILNGDWSDPYSDQNFSSAADIQIDHFVPLKNAYMVGAFEWSKLKRCLYANYLGNSFHLLSVSGKENLRKSDKTPGQYMPQSSRYACTYLRQWLAVKAIWSLRLTPKEAKAVTTLFTAHQCDEKEFVLTFSFLNEQKNFMQSHANLCQNLSPSSEQVH